MDDSHLFLQAKREKRWLAFIEVRVSHLFSQAKQRKRWLTATIMDDSHLFLHTKWKEVAAINTGCDSHLFPSTSCLCTPWADLVSMADSPWCVMGKPVESWLRPSQCKGTK
jgi:hypothetical protein